MKTSKTKKRTRKPIIASTKVRSKPSRTLTSKAKKSVRKAARKNYPVHKRVLMHPATVFALLCTGVFIGGWTYQVIADTTISSVIEAPALSDGAIIASPIDGTSTTTNPIDVTGSCPDNSYVKLYQNGAFAGVAWCVSETFDITTSLFEGTNTLNAKDYNVTDEQGPTTSNVEVTYVPPPAPPAPPTPSTPATPTTTSPSKTDTSSTPITADSPVVTPAAAPDDSQPPLLLTSDFHFQTFSPQKEFTWQVDVEGGTPPYDVYIDWGDGTTSTYHYDADPLITITHTFKTTGYFAIVIKSVDKYSQTKVTQLAALITPKAGQSTFSGVASTGSGTTTAAGSGSTGGNLPGTAIQSKLVTTRKWLFLAWPSYVIIMLMVVSFWLGERREYAYIKVKRRH